VAQLSTLGIIRTMNKLAPYFLSYFIVSLATLVFNNVLMFHSPVSTHTVVVRTSMSVSELTEKLKQMDIPKDAILQPWAMPQKFYVGHFVYLAIIFLVFMGLARFFKSRAKSDDHDA
jgi:hypothetical protein